MNPVAFSLFGLEVAWYGILISIGVMLGIIVALKEAKRNQFKEDDLLDFLIYAIPLAIVGARAYYVIFSWDFYGKNPSEILNIRNGGLAIHGAIIAGILFGIAYSRWKKTSLFTLLDFIMPGLALGQSIGRWGNYINQEAYGGPTDLPWAITVNGTKVHPTFLYESICNFAIFLFLLWFARNKKKKDGEVLALYFILYSLVRFFIEGLRTDSLMFLGMRVAQLLSLSAILLGIGILIYLNKKRTSKEN